MEGKLTISDVSGPFREPREPIFSYDYSIQRPTWATPHGVRVKVSIPDELDVVREQLLGAVTGSAGQQLVIGKILSRAIADGKLRIAEDEGMLAERRDVMLDPFTGPLAHLFPKLQHLLAQQQASVRDEIKKRAGL
ncbi:hypothetical protein ACO9S2_16845 [Nitrospira sp. NS4]|uniref:hypothetical protein n=1 Tax=Nitrospira sp. NS4 TaxID=3414498 RepID=UPI003C2B4273